MKDTGWDNLRIFLKRDIKVIFVFTIVLVT